jgi:hypothetical protein
MCKIDWDEELGNAPSSTVYASLSYLKQQHPCWEECGIVEVEVSLVEIIAGGR